MHYSYLQCNYEKISNQGVDCHQMTYQFTQGTSYNHHHATSILSHQEIEGDEQKKLELCWKSGEIRITCPLCNNYLIHATTVVPCQHTFCELCIEEYLHYLGDCPTCETAIRHNPKNKNILLDNLVSNYVDRFANEDSCELRKRESDYKKFKERRRLGQVEAGVLVDVRTLDYVWCKGVIISTSYKVSQKKFMVLNIRYEKDRRCEEIREDSARLAPYGFYTNRMDLPRYQGNRLILQWQDQGIEYSVDSESESFQPYSTFN